MPKRVEMLTEQKVQEILLSLKASALHIQYFASRLGNTDTVKGAKMNRISRDIKRILEELDALIKPDFKKGLFIA